MNIHRLRKRAEFVAMRDHGVAVAKRYVVVQHAPLSAISSIPLDSPDCYVGFTVTKKCGNAVRRNRIKRRLRAAVRDIFPQHAQAGMAYVIIGRFHAHDAPYDALCDSLRYALHAAHDAVQAA